MKNVINIIQATCHISDETLDLFKSHLTACHFPKRSLIVKSGTYNKYVYFIDKGMTRHYWSVDGVEINTSFSIEGGILFSMDEMYYDKPSEEFIEAVEDIDAYRMPISVLNELFETNIELANWGRIIHQNEYRRLHRSHKELITLRAKDRYFAFANQFPEVIKRANLGYIASYLGITLSTLSKLRGEKE